MQKAYSAEIISVGTELLLGNIANTDARDLSERLSALGINVFYHSVVGDNPERLQSVVSIAKQRADIIITTGGLGPTCDDLTKQVLADSFNLRLYFDEREAETIRDFFEKRLHGAKMTENNLQQAMLPEGCTVFRNQWGTAPGCAFFADGVHVIMLPGPPRECRAMFEHCALPYLYKLSDSQILSHNIRVFGEGESAVEARLRDMMNELTNPTLAPYAKEGDVMLRVTAKAHSAKEAEMMMAPVLEKVRGILGDMIYGVDVENLEEAVLALLTEKELTLAAAESCTGGLLSKRITDIPGASRCFLGGVTVYSDKSKSSLLGVPEQLISEKGAVSRDVALHMAEGARRVFGSDIAVGITGFAGPSSSGAEEVGAVFIALSTPEGNFARELYLGLGRDRIRITSANHALDMIRRYITGLPVESWLSNA